MNLLSAVAMCGAGAAAWPRREGEVWWSMSTGTFRVRSVGIRPSQPSLNVAHSLRFDASKWQRAILWQLKHMGTVCMHVASGRVPSCTGRHGSIACMQLLLTSLLHELLAEGPRSSAPHVHLMAFEHFDVVAHHATNM